MPKGKPNILVLWGDDIGITNLSCYSDGLMGYRTPNIDRIANEGVRFTDYYGEQSCTAGRSAFITGQSVYRTGLSKVGLPGADIGLHEDDPTIATALKEQGYRTGQFGKNHFGDKDEYLPTNRGFDEFFGNLYHLNAEEEPENEDYPTDEEIPNWSARYRPRGVIHSWAQPDGTQKVEDTGPLTKKRMETVDEEIVPEAQRFIRDAVDDEEPFFLWFNTTGMHFRTHIKDEIRGQAGRWQSEYHDAMVEHDKRIGEMLDLVDELGIAEDTIVLYSTDNGVHLNSWPDAGMTPFRNEKNSMWEGAYRVPSLARWTGHWREGEVLNGMAAHLDWFTTLLSAAGVANVAGDLRAGTSLNGRDYKVHLDGEDLNPYLSGEVDESPRNRYFYFSDNGDLCAIRWNNWKIVWLEQRAVGTLQVWREPYTELRIPLIFNLRTDPFERANITSNTYEDWMIDHAYMMGPAVFYVNDMAQTLHEFPVRQEPASFTIDKVLRMLEAGIAST